MNLKMTLWRLLWPFRSRRHQGLSAGDYFPDFTLADAEGRRQTLSESSGRITALWLTNLCEDCLTKVPLLEELSREGSDGFRVLAVSLLGEERELARRVSAQGGFPVLLDPEDIVARDLGMPHPAGSCPLHNLFLLDKDGRILFRHHLSALSPDAFRAIWRTMDRK